MKLATYRDGSRDGQLVLVTSRLEEAVFVSDIAQTLQCALDRWDAVERDLRRRAALLEAGQLAGAFPFQASMCMAPLPRAYQWADGSAYLNHVELVRKARGAAMPAELYSDPLMYQGGSDMLLGPTDDIVFQDASWGIDFEAELALILGDLPAGVSAEAASKGARLAVLVNDVSLRDLIPTELAKGFGFVQSKPASAFSPVAVTLDELGPAWDGERVHLDLAVWRNNEQVGNLRSGEDMHFSFADLASHLCRTRSVCAGTLLGAGTVSNRRAGAGFGCIAEKRMLEILEEGRAATPYLQDGETVRIEAFDSSGHTVFGPIHQKVVVSSCA
ncbi:fumarylacetoacetate hydrolase family protein [Hydrogenophaga sp. PML113]|uniref:fumarylacetoacetate hydrolase family protein n=1 Tax=Hydrogenophaga sp. PML113 TaxID=1899350 RepID=UPI0009F6530F|nr:fumarylacetoacetate hydrolase family protein [Hydrogenophaga sp. PML113]